MKKGWHVVVFLVVILFIAVGCGTSSDENGGTSGIDNSDISGDDNSGTPGDENGQDTAEEPTDGALLPVLFIHGTSGSASQFESQAQRFMANGYPREYLDAFEYDSGPFAAAAGDIPTITALLYDPGLHTRIKARIDQLLADTGQKKVNLIGHSLGTLVSNAFLKTDDNAQRVARYVNVDGTNGQGTGTPFGGVKTLALWGMSNPDTNALGDTATDDHDNTQAHIEVCTSATSFAKIYQFFSGEAPATTQIPEAEDDTVMIAGKANIFPENVGAEGAVLSIYEVDPDTGFRTSDVPIEDGAWDIGADGEWGPVAVTKGATYEFVLVQGADTHIYYREPFYADDYFIRFNTSRPGEGLAGQLMHSENHTILMIGRDKEMWGDQGDGNDLLLVNGNPVLTEEAAAQSRRLSGLFLSDENLNQSSDLGIIAAVNQASFISGIDFYIPAASPPDRTVTIKLTSRGSGGVTQIIRVPNWNSDEVQTVSVQFRDFVQ